MFLQVGSKHDSFYSRVGTWSSTFRRGSRFLYAQHLLKTCGAQSRGFNPACVQTKSQILRERFKPSVYHQLTAAMLWCFGVCPPPDGSDDSARRHTCAGTTKPPPTTPGNPHEKSSVYGRWVRQGLRGSWSRAWKGVRLCRESVRGTVRGGYGAINSGGCLAVLLPPPGHPAHEQEV